MPIQGLPRDAKFLAQVADLGLWLTHCRHRQPQLGEFAHARRVGVAGEGLQRDLGHAVWKGTKAHA